MSRSYVVNDGGKLHMIGRKVNAPDGAISRGEAASILMCDPDAVEGEIMALRTGLDTECRTKLIDGELFVHGGDCRQLANAKLRGEHRRRPAPPSPPAPSPRRERIELSDPGRVAPSPPPQPRKAQAVTIADAADQAGLTEEELTTRILGKARLKMVDGQMVVSVADLNRLAGKGTIPKPSEQGKMDAMLRQLEGKPTRNAALDARTDRMAQALGMEDGGDDRAVSDRTEKVAASLGVEGIDKPDQGEQKPEPRSGAVKVTADRKPYRLGRPKRWGER